MRPGGPRNGINDRASGMTVRLYREEDKILPEPQDQTKDLQDRTGPDIGCGNLPIGAKRDSNAI